MVTCEYRTSSYEVICLVLTLLRGPLPSRYPQQAALHLQGRLSGQCPHRRDELLQPHSGLRWMKYKLHLSGVLHCRFSVFMQGQYGHQARLSLC